MTIYTPKHNLLQADIEHRAAKTAGRIHKAKLALAASCASVSVFFVMLQLPGAAAPSFAQMDASVTLHRPPPQNTGNVLGISTTNKKLAATKYTAAMSATQITALINHTVQQYVNSGLLTGPMGPQGPQGPAGLSSGLAPGFSGPNGIVQNSNGNTTAVIGGTPIVSYYPPVQSSGFSGTSLAGFGTLSASSFTTGSASVTGNLTITGNASFTSGTFSSGLTAATSTLSSLTVSGPATFSGSTTIAGLTVTGLNPGLTPGSVAFQGASALSQDNANFFYDTTNHRLGLGTTTPGSTLTVAGNSLFTGNQTISGILTVSGTSSLATTTISTLQLTSALPISSGGTGATTATSATANLQFLQTGTGATARTVTSKLSDFVSVKDFGAQCDGTTNDTAAIASAMTAAATSGKTVYFPAGTCVANVTIPDGVDVRGVPGQSVIKAATSAPVVTVTSASVVGNRYGLVSGLVLECNTASAIGLSVGLAVQRKFENLFAQNCTTASFRLDASQNNLFDSINSYNSPVCLQIMNGAGNNNISRLECDTQGTTGIYVGQDNTLPGWSWNLFSRVPTSNTIERYIVERGALTKDVWISNGNDNTFRDGNLSAQTSGSGMDAIVQLDSTGSTSLNKFENTYISTGASLDVPHVVNNGFRNMWVNGWHEGSAVTSVIKTSNVLWIYHPFFANSGMTIANTAGNAATNIQVEYINLIGDSASRPSWGTAGFRGTYFNTTIGQPEWYNGSAWVNAAGGANGTWPLNGNLTFTTDASYDIGASGANRPRVGYFSSDVNIGTTSTFTLTSRSRLGAPAGDGTIALFNNALTDFGRLQFGGTSSSFPAIKRNGTSLSMRLADDSADASITALNLTASGSIMLPYGNALRVSDAVTYPNILSSGWNGSADFLKLFTPGGNNGGNPFLTGLSSGNVGIGTTTPTLGPLTMASGAYVTSGGVWTNASDRNLKENFATMSPASILGQIEQLPITEWNYKDEDPSIKHIGPVAQDFYALFHVGNSDKSISTIDPSGIALLGIQALDQKITALQGSLTGNATTSNLTVYSPSQFSGDSVGQAQILPGQTSVRVTFNQPYQYQPIITFSPEGAAAGQAIAHGAYITAVDNTGFTIQIVSSAPALVTSASVTSPTDTAQLPTTEPLTFDWHSFASPAEQLTVSDGSAQPIQLIVPAAPYQAAADITLPVVSTPSAATTAAATDATSSTPASPASTTASSVAASSSTSTPVSVIAPAASGSVLGTSTPASSPKAAAAAPTPAPNPPAASAVSEDPASAPALKPSSTPATTPTETAAAPAAPIAPTAPETKSQWPAAAPAVETAPAPIAPSAAPASTPIK